MTDDHDASVPTDSTPAGTECALCGTDLSPREYADCRAVLIDESGSDGDEETIRMVCADCWSGLDEELGDPSGSPSTPSA